MLKSNIEMHMLYECSRWDVNQQLFICTRLENSNGTKSLSVSELEVYWDGLQEYWWGAIYRNMDNSNTDASLKVHTSMDNDSLFWNSRHEPACPTLFPKSTGVSSFNFLNLKKLRSRVSVSLQRKLICKNII